MTSPCKGCANRFLGCHSCCAGYQEFQTERELISDKRQQEFKTQEYFTNSIRKTIKSRDKASSYSMSVN